MSHRICSCTCECVATVTGPAAVCASCDAGNCLRASLVADWAAGIGPVLPPMAMVDPSSAALQAQVTARYAFALERQVTTEGGGLVWRTR